MKNHERQTANREHASGRRLGKARFAAVSVMCAVLIAVAVVVAGGVPLGGSGPMGAWPVGAEVGGATTDASRSTGAPDGDTSSSAGVAGAGAENDGQPQSQDEEGGSPEASADSSSRGATAKTPSKPAKTPDGMVVPEEMVPVVNVEHEREDVLVTFADGYSAEEVTAAIGKSGCTVPQTITADDLNVGFATLKVADGYDVEHAMTQLGMLPELGGAQPNFIYRIQDDSTGAGAAIDKAGAGNGSGSGAIGLHGGLSGANSLINGGKSLSGQETPNDPRITEQWALESVNAYGAWDETRVDGAVTVAVFDNGCRVDHEDLKGNIVGQYDAINGDDKVEYGSHGTHVAGIIAAEANNAKGVAGVSYNAKLFPVQVLTADKSKGDSETVCRAFKYILDNRPDVKVINASFGGKSKGDSAEDISLKDYDAALIKAVNDAYDRGVLTVFSAGNDVDPSKQDGPYLNFPSDWADNALGVIALQKGADGGDPTRADYSNYNMDNQTTKDIAAPGSDILSTGPGNAGEYFSNSGTSMAAPCVSGVAALVYAARPDATAAEVAGILFQSARKINSSANAEAGSSTNAGAGSSPNSLAEYGANGFSQEYGYGEVDAEAAVSLANVLHVSGEKSVGKGGTTTLSIEHRDGLEVEGAWTWSSNKPDVATVDGGVVTGVGPGTATITAESGTAKVSKAITVYDASLSAEGALTYGTTGTMTLTSNPSAAWSLSLSDKSIASLPVTTASGESIAINIIGTKAGSTELTATLVSNPSVKVSRTITVRPADIAGAVVGSIGNQAYTGGAVEPKPIVTFGGKALVEGADYTLSYQNNVQANVSSVNPPTVVVTGEGNFTGTTSVAFKICAAAIADADVTLSATSFVYDGTAHKPAVTVRCDGTTLRPGTHYAVVYGDNRDAGTARVEVQGIGNYAGTVEKRFKITRAKVEVPTAVSGLMYNGGVQTGVKAASWASCTLSGNTARNAGAHTATARLKDTANYQWADGTTAEKRIAWSIAAKPVVPVVVLSKTSFTYNASMQRPAVTVKAGSTTLGGADYALAWSRGCKNAGTYKASVTCKGNYTGKASATFTIRKAANTAKIAKQLKTVKASKLKKQARSVKAITVSGARGTVSYAKVKEGSSKKLTVNRKTGKITVKKGTRNGLYKVKVKVKVAGTANYKSLTKTVTAKVRVK